MAAPAAKLKPSPLSTPLSNSVTEAFAIVIEGTGAERKFVGLRLTITAGVVTAVNEIDRSWHRDLAEDAVRRALRPK